MTDLTYDAAIANVYVALKADNTDLELHIAALREAMAREGRSEAVFDASKLAQNNRQGRKYMQAYFRQRGVKVAFG